MASFDLNEYVDGRRQFTTEEWIDLLIRTIGLEPAGMEKRLKMLYLLRLVPLAEPNYNLVELGPRETGKSFGYQQLSPYAILLTGPNHRGEPVLQHRHETHRPGGSVGRGCV